VRHHAPRHVRRFQAAVAIRTAFEQEGELSAAIELRRRFPGITDNAEARECAQAAGCLRFRRIPHMRLIPVVVLLLPFALGGCVSSSPPPPASDTTITAPPGATPAHY
jgi:hypothetical protein